MVLERFIQKLKDKESIVGIIGLGYVGLPLSLAYVDAGIKVMGFDIDQKKIDNLIKGESYIKHIDEKKVRDAVHRKMLEPTSELSLIEHVDAIIICVPTPLNTHREPDLSYVAKTVESIIPYVREGQLISLESTTYPGTTETYIKKPLEEKGMHIGENIFVVYSPEREDPGNKKYTTSEIAKVIGGSTKNCLKAGTKLYEAAFKTVVEVSSLETAEMTKLMENIHRAVNIGLVNELKPVAEAMGIDMYEVIEAASTKPFGFVPYYPGPGLGGHCIPIDPFYLTWKAREYGMNTKFIELAGEINTSMPKYVVDSLANELNKKGNYEWKQMFDCWSSL